MVQLVDKIDAKAERKVEKELIRELRRVSGKEGILFRIAEAAVDRPDDTVRTVIYPGAGEGTLRQLVAEARANKRRSTPRCVRCCARRTRITTGGYCRIYVCGAWAGEVCGLCVEELDLRTDDEHVRIHGKGSGGPLSYDAARHRWTVTAR